MTINDHQWPSDPLKAMACLKFTRFKPTLYFLNKDHSNKSYLTRCTISRTGTTLVDEIDWRWHHGIANSIQFHVYQNLASLMSMFIHVHIDIYIERERYGYRFRYWYRYGYIYMQYLPLCLSIRPSIRLSTSLSLFIYIYVCVCIYIHTYIYTYLYF